MMRSVVCVAGCCGPKLSVHRYSRSFVSVGSVSASVNGMMDYKRQLLATESTEITEDDKIESDYKTTLRHQTHFAFLPLCVLCALCGKKLTLRPCNHREIMPLS